MSATHAARRFLTTTLTTLMLTSPVAAIPAAAADGSSAAVGTSAAVTRRIVVSIPDKQLALMEDGRVVSQYPVAVGAPVSPSPVGTFTIVNRVSNPTYYRPGRIIEPGTTNPIGMRWIGLSEKGF